MRATARIQFQRFIEEEEYEQQELARIEAEEAAAIELALLQEQERIAECEREARELHAVAVEILSHFNLESHVARFLESPDGLAVLANCCNCAAKWHDGDLYEHKPILINLATKEHPECWQASGVVYIETAVGQVSFHALYGEDEGLPEADGRVWSELEMQFNAPLVAQAFLEGWSKEVLQQKIVESAASEELAA